MRVLIVSLFAVASCASAPDPRAEQAEAAMQALAQGGFTGSALVACDEEVIFAGNYGVESEAPSYWLASISKQFAAAAILRLAEAGRLRLDDPIARFLPEAPSDKASITLAQLMSHRSGLPQAYAADGVADRSTAARAIFATPLRETPGTAFVYSNDNYSLLAMVVEIASGVRFEEYVRANLLEPAGMSDSGFWPDAADDYVPPLLAPLTGPAASANWGFRGGTGMRASVRDLHRWMRALDTGRVLAPESVALLYGPHGQTSGGDGVGYGWFWSDDAAGRWLWTRGYDTSGSNAVLYRFWGTPLAIIAATNAGPAEDVGPGWSRQARDALMEIYDAGACAD